MSERSDRLISYLNAVENKDYTTIAQLIRLSEIQAITYAYLDKLSLISSDWDKVANVAFDYDNDAYSYYTAYSFAHITAREAGEVTDQDEQKVHNELWAYSREIGRGFNDVMESALNRHVRSEMLLESGKHYAYMFFSDVLKENGAGKEEIDDFVLNRNNKLADEYKLPKILFEN